MTDTPLSTPAAQGTVVADWTAKAQELYDRCKSWPEKTPEGFMALLELRNHVHALLTSTPSLEAVPAGGVDVARKLRLAASSYGHSIPDSIRELMLEAAAALTSAPAPEDR